MAEATNLRATPPETPITKSVAAQALEEMARIRAHHVEMLCAAYVKMTDVIPADVELVEEVNGRVTRWYFRSRAAC